MPTLDDYFVLLNASEVVKGATVTSLSYIKSAFGFEWSAQDVFLCNPRLRKEDSQPTLTSLWVITPTYMIECKNIQKSVNFDLASVRDIEWFQVTAKEYDFATPTTQSVLNVNGFIGARSTFELNATGGNCSRLHMLVTTCLAKWAR